MAVTDPALQTDTHQYGSLLIALTKLFVLCITPILNLSLLSINDFSVFVMNSRMYSKKLLRLYCMLSAVAIEVGLTFSDEYSLRQVSCKPAR